MKCQYCLEDLFVTLNSSLGKRYHCDACKVYYYLSEDDKIRLKSLQTFFNGRFYYLDINYDSKCSTICKGPIVIETFNYIIETDPKSVEQKIKTILIFS